MKIFRAQRFSSGLSTFEILVLVAAAGLLAAIAAPVITGPTEEDLLLSHQQNAQELATAFHSGKVAGVSSFVVGSQGAPHEDVETVVQELVLGGTPERGLFKGRYFGVPELIPIEVEAATEFLSWDRENTVLLYTGPILPEYPE